MDIKLILKENGWKLTDFSKEISLSRPTLNSYIKTFEGGELITNQKYQSIFEMLFNDENISNKSFNKVIRRFGIQIKRDIYLGVKDLDYDKSNLIRDLNDKQVQYIKSHNFNTDMIKYFTLLLDQSNDLFIERHMNFYLYLNAVKHIDKITDEEKSYISRIFKLYNDYELNPKIILEEYYNKFVQEVEKREKESLEKVKIRNEELQDSIKEFIEEKLEELVSTHLENGVPMSQINLNELVKEINMNDFYIRNSNEEKKKD